MQYRLCSYLVNTEENTLTDTTHQKQFHIEPRMIAVLLLSIEKPEKVISREKL